MAQKHQNLYKLIPVSEEVHQELKLLAVQEHKTMGEEVGFLVEARRKELLTK